MRYYDLFKISLSLDDFIVTFGRYDAMLFAFMSCLNPGDDIIISEHVYENYMNFAISARDVILGVSSTIEEGFCLSKIEKFKKLINNKTKSINICNPNKPTGYLYSQTEMNQIQNLDKKHGLYIFSDEAYQEFIYTGSPYISAMHLKGIEDNVILI